MVREDLSIGVAFGAKKSFPVTENSKCKAPDAGMCLFKGQQKKTNLAEAERGKERVAGD